MSHPAPAVGVPSESEVSVRVVHALCGFLESAGVTRAKLLRAADIEVDLDSADTRLSRANVYRLCEAAMDLTGDPALGLRWAEGLSGHSFTPISNLMAHAPTLREALATLSQFRRLLSDRIGFEVIENDDTVSVRCQRLEGESARIQKFVAEMIVSSMFKVIRSFGVPPPSTQVYFDFPAPSHRAEYDRVFLGRAQFEQPNSGIEFDRAFMNSASPHKDEDVHLALRSIAERRIMRLTRNTPYAERVRDVLVQHGASGLTTSMEAVANSLGLSVRSLRRRLAEEGKTYKSATNEAFAITAKHMLGSTHRTIQEIAFELGFADTSAFHRAFKRRTGMTPRQYRSQQLQTK